MPWKSNEELLAALIANQKDQELMWAKPQPLPTTYHFPGIRWNAATEEYERG